jgi:hypothetical protein
MDTTSASVVRFDSPPLQFHLDALTLLPIAYCIAAATSASIGRVMAYLCKLLQ